MFISQRRAVAAACLLAATILIGACASSRKVTSTGEVDPGQKKLTSFALRYASTLSGEVPVVYTTRVSVYDMNKPIAQPVELDPQNKQILRTQTQDLARVVEKGVRERFAKFAARYKLQIIAADGAPAEVPVLTITASHALGHCPGLGCYATMYVRGNVRGPNLTPWSMQDEVGPNMVGNSVDDGHFDFFAKRLLEQLVKDGLIASP